MLSTTADSLSSDAPDDPNRTPGRLAPRRRVGIALATLAAFVAFGRSPILPAEAASSAVPLPDGFANPSGARTVAGHGYRLVSSDGGVFSLGWYGHAGSMAGQNAGSIVGLANTPSGRGYWLAGSTGGVFALGDAAYRGALGDHGVTAAVVGIAAAPRGDGYWLVSREGGIFAFGDAPYLGALADHGASATVVGIAATPTGDGYWLVSRDGGIFAFGDATYFGSAGDVGAKVVAAAVTPTRDGDGYWIVGRDGGIFNFGAAEYHGSLGGRQLGAPIVGAASGLGYSEPLDQAAIEANVPAKAAAPPPPPPAPRAAAPLPESAAQRAGRDADVGGRMGYDISWPQCDGAYPAAPFAFGIVGITGGRAFKHNRCLADQWKWAKASGAAAGYINVNFPYRPDELDRGATGPQPDCMGDLPCIAYNFGYNGAKDGLAYATQQGVDLPFVWLDIETMNYWMADVNFNAVVIRGAIDAVRHSGKDLGIYSTPYQWRKIAGGFSPGVPMWIAGAPNLEAAPGWCNRSFAGGPVVIVQTLPIVFDENYTCPGQGPMRRYFAG